mgnify:CR=1 FL=1
MTKEEDIWVTEMGVFWELLILRQLSDPKMNEQKPIGITEVNTN